MLVSKFGDRFSDYRLYEIGILIRAFVWLTFIFVGDVYQIIILQIILGIGEGLGTSSFYSVIARHLDKGKYVKDFAYWKITANIAEAIATITGGFIASRLGFDALFLLMFTLAIISFFGINIHKAILKRNANGMGNKN